MEVFSIILRVKKKPFFLRPFSPIVLQVCFCFYQVHKLVAELGMEPRCLGFKLMPYLQDRYLKQFPLTCQEYFPKTLNGGNVV